jgi:hypothetical protein
MKRATAGLLSWVGRAAPAPLFLPVVAIALSGSLPAQAADPTTPECLSASDQSITLRNQHKLRAARAQLLICAASSCPAEVRNDCAKGVSDINTALPSIVFEAKDPAGNDLSAVKVTMDGQALTDKLDGASVAIDPGDHAFTFETPGQPTVQKSFVIREAEKERHERIQFGTPIAGASGGAEGKGGGTTTIVVNDSGNSGQKTIAFIVGGVGIAGLIAGGALIGLAFNLKSQSDTENARSAGSGHSDYEASLQDNTLGWIVGGVGAAALTTGVVLLVTAGGGKSGDAPKPAVTWRVAPDVGPGHAGLGLLGTF